MKTIDLRPARPAESGDADALPKRSLGLLAAALTGCAFFVLLPCSISLILGSWFAWLTRPWMTWLIKRLHGRTRAAAILTSVIVIALLGPIVLAIVPVVTSAVELASEVGQSRAWRDAARSVVGQGASDVDLMRLAREHAASAWSAVRQILTTSATVLFGIVMFVVSLFAFSASGEKTVVWLRSHSPLRASHFDRLAHAYMEAGRGLIVGVGVTALLQGVLAAMIYAAVGIPRAVALGLLTMVTALIPGVGTLLVWGPVTAILALGGYPGKAAAVGLGAVILVSSVDNFLKPILSKRAHLGVPAVLVFITMLSGVVALGPAGLLLGPLFVRMAMETLSIAREEGWVGPREVSSGIVKSPSPK